MDGEVSKLLDGVPQLDDWVAEYRAMLGACALAARADRGAVRVAGERAAEMLNGLLTNQVVGLAGVGRHALLLTPKGRVLTDLRVFPRPDWVLLDVPLAGLRNLLGAFRKYLPPLYARFEDASDALCQVAIYGPLAADAAGAALGERPAEEHLGVRELQLDGAPVLVIRNRRLAGDGVEFIVAAEAAAAVAGRLLSAVAAAGGRAAGVRALEVVRVESGVPRYGVDIDDSNLAQETGLEAEAISYDKGCYLGQEVVARVHFRGHVNRHLTGFEFEPELPAPGAALYQGEREVGLVTSAVESPAFGPIGLGYVRREIMPPSILHWSDGEHEGTATLVELPLRSGAV